MLACIIVSVYWLVWKHVFRHKIVLNARQWTRIIPYIIIPSQYMCNKMYKFFFHSNVIRDNIAFLLLVSLQKVLP